MVAFLVSFTLKINKNMNKINIDRKLLVVIITLLRQLSHSIVRRGLDDWDIFKGYFSEQPYLHSVTTFLDNLLIIHNIDMIKHIDKNMYLYCDYVTENKNNIEFLPFSAFSYEEHRRVIHLLTNLIFNTNYLTVEEICSITYILKIFITVIHKKEDPTVDKYTGLAMPMAYLSSYLAYDRLTAKEQKVVSKVEHWGQSFNHTYYSIDNILLQLKV